ncbi:gluconate 2-dehydrogenase subunit 3 family protein [Terriglobus roseus]|uniref:Gluconate 2-dehydrogenase subunit 3 n=1 Tax=Terriglobus roseus TaxID=392734 RepID=A0A1G7HD48_9BACT|nr:gluconate 2-dehydrogenase subunit 3 family protein [Terriglobus roseus]SDE98397.1 Gluconate 2-dehydrogenase subunit 3 [Terriglobus roseus]
MSDPTKNSNEEQALPQRVQPGYYPGWNVLSQSAYWDAATRKVVEERMGPPKQLRFFHEAEAQAMTAILDRILPQDDRLPAQRIPLLPSLDARLFENRIEGYRYEDMPSDQQAYRWAVEAMDRMALEVFNGLFAELTSHSQEVLLKSLHDGEPMGAKDLWQRMNVERFWTLLLNDACAAYYAHPWAWNEIGFGGPAYPRGYMRLEEGEPEPWEFVEQRYEWAGPTGSLSDLDRGGLAGED